MACSRGVVALIVVLSFGTVSGSVALHAQSGRPAENFFPVDTAGLAEGPHATLEATLQRTIFGIEILGLAMRVDPDTQRELGSIVAEQRYSEARAQRVAEAMLDAHDVVVVAEFRRSVSFERFIREVRRDVRRAWEADLISDEVYRDVWESLPEWFSPLEQRGMQAGDRLIYRVRPDSLRTVFMTEDGEIWVDQIDEGQGPRQVLLGSYFAPGAAFREPLIRSLFDS